PPRYTPFPYTTLFRSDAQMPFSILILATAIVVFLLVLPSGGAGGVGQWVMRYIYQPLEAAFLALLVFFIGTAVYRALHVRTWERSEEHTSELQSLRHL